ncbi:arginine repressor [Photobacterium sp. GB-27]|uniref:arginine repressor n=1 Tax=Photobacterium sp. GB-27 TaxID=2022109 RepID=UPI000D15869F|nr:arginine repressor [Photobacterium sp. GB-27]PSV35984.1 arginine repressor [Photobacterium sp. GB-27]
MNGHESPHGIISHYCEKNMTAVCKQLLQMHHFSTQDHIRDALIKEGFDDISQSTVSRLLTKLKIVKAPNVYGKRVYCVTETTNPTYTDSEIASQIEFVTHNKLVIVVKTHPGSAQLIARIIDLHPHQEILGTIAGNDTIMVAPCHIDRISDCEKAVCLSLGMI